MFAAIRQRLVGAWTRLREGNLAKLFAFEFTVVLLGVLAAQGVADWAGERAADRRAMEAAALAEELLAESAAVAAQWEGQAHCFEAQMRDVMRASTRGAPLDPVRLQRPSVALPAPFRIPPDQIVRLRRLRGEEVAWHFDSAADQVDRFDERLIELADTWRAFALLEPRNGTPDATDYRDARRAAANILTLMDGLSINARNIAASAAVIGVEPWQDPRGGRVANSCAEMWIYGKSRFTAEDFDAEGRLTLQPRVAGDSEDVGL
ncbi:hypothetical protein [Sphingomicrobium arenosum]|uniref:hypothetical protein n=1 Tax=Sphingomicrobium arenosum TaxID=2233861 RepID=UPI002240FBEE|nr:hypothetical protein [Sphingomicrobium arenosum]